jgi:hypothetical protein
MNRIEIRRGGEGAGDFKEGETLG